MPTAPPVSPDQNLSPCSVPAPRAPPGSQEDGCPGQGHCVGNRRESQSPSVTQRHEGWACRPPPTHTHTGTRAGPSQQALYPPAVPAQLLQRPALFISPVRIPRHQVQELVLKSPGLGGREDAVPAKPSSFMRRLPLPGVKGLKWGKRGTWAAEAPRPRAQNYPPARNLGCNSRPSPPDGGPRPFLLFARGTMCVTYAAARERTHRLTLSFRMCRTLVRVCFSIDSGLANTLRGVSCGHFTDEASKAERA